MTVKNVFFTIFCLCLVLITTRVYMQQGVPYTHDGENHLARFANYRAAIREGQFPPRFAPNLENGYGYPVFNYNYPLANILSVPLTIVGFSYETTFKLLIVAFLAFGAHALWRLSSLYTDSFWGKTCALLVWLSSPFLVSTVLFRGSIGELLVYGLVPGLLYHLTLIARGRNLHVWDFVLWVAFFLAHNVSVLWVTPILLSYFLLVWWQNKHPVEHLVRCTYLLSVSVAASLWFWLPAITEMSAVVLGSAENTLMFAQHFPTLQQLVSAPVQFGYSYPGSVDTMSFALGSIVWLSFLVFPVWFFSSGSAASVKQHTRDMLFWGWSVMALLLFLQLHMSHGAWQLLPFLRFIQFPWRLSLLIPVLSAMLIGTMVSTLGVRFRVVIFVFLVGYWLALTSVQPLEFLHHADARYDSFPLSTSTQNENRSQAFTFTDIGNNPRKPFVSAGTGEISQVSWGGSSRSYTVTTSEPNTIIEPTMNFPGWSTMANGEVVEYIDSTEIGGRIAYVVPAGQFSVSTVFTQRTVPRRIGNTISLVAVVWIFIGEGLLRKKAL